MLNKLVSLQEATAAFVDEQRSAIWVGHADGALRRVSFAGDTLLAQTLPSGVTGMDGRAQTLIVALADGSVRSLDLDDPGAAAVEISRHRANYGQLGLSSAIAPTAAIVTGGHTPLRRPPFGGSGSTLSLVKVGDGSISNVAISGLTGVAIAGRTVYVARNSGLPLRGLIASLRGSQLRNLATGLPAAGRIGLAERGALLLLAHPGSGRLSAVRPATGAVETVSTSAVDGGVIEAHGLGDGRIAILAGTGLYLIDTLADLTRDPRIDPIGAPIFVGSWVELGFDLGTTGLTRNDVHFDVPDGPEAGFVSYTRPNGVGDPVPLLVVGGKAGTHKVRLIENATSAELASIDFEITDHWPDDDVGPAGFYSASASMDGGGWGGGPGSPQNVATQPHSGTWRAMVLMVDTSSARWPADAPTMNANRTSILGHVSDGVAFNGDSRSARIYYEENSRYTPGSGGNPDRGLTLQVYNNQAFGPVSLPNAWTDYFAQKVADDGTILDDRWSSKGATVQTIISRAIADGVATTADFSAIDVLIMLPFSPGGADSQFVWPHAHDALTWLCGNNPMTDQRSFGFIFAPLDFDVQDGRQLHTTLSHELGHTLGLPDLYDFPDSYSDDVSARVTTDWDMMGGSRDALPHYTISNKMRMGWIPAGQVKLYNFQGSSAVAENITLHAAELGDAPAGQFKTIEIRLGDGWNYYVEYRAEQAALISDDLLSDRQVVITDVTSDSYTAPLARPPILFVHKDIDGDGPLIGSGSDFEEKDPGTQMDLKVEVVSTAADNAVVKVSYGSNGKPEPGIRPWSGAASNWQSPDIEIRNDKATADPGRWFNTPWVGHDNIVVAKIKNSGDLLAKGVVVDFFVTEYSSGDGPWAPLGSDTQDVGPGATVEFKVGWSPPADEDRHYCVIVRIRLYQDPGNLAVVDQNIYNNEARSNYTSFVSASASPSSRVGAAVLLANPFDRPTNVFAAVKKTHPQHRVFIDHQWLRVAGKGQRSIRVWDEAVWGTPEWKLIADEREQRVPKQLWEIPNRLSITGWAARPFEADCGARTLTGGVGMKIGAGRATTIKLRAKRPTYVAGEVVFTNGSSVTAGGAVLIEIRADDGKYFTLATPVDPTGSFGRDFSNPFGTEHTKSIEAHYLGAFSAAPCTTGPIPI